VRVDSAASGCFGTSGIPVQTKYRFFDQGSGVDRILVHRKFSFGSTPFIHDFRPYIPRLYPRDRYSVVIHPDGAGTALATEVGNDCEFGCAVSNWNGTWFAIHDPASGRGMIVRHLFSSIPVPYGSTWTGARGRRPRPCCCSSRRAGSVSEVESFCFYDAESWTPGLVTPPSC